MDDLQADNEDEYLECHRAVNELEFERQRREAELEKVEEEIEAIEGRLAEREDLEAEHEDLTDEIESLRNRIERVEADVVEHSNAQMEELLDRLEFRNRERVWIEQVQSEGSSGRSAGPTTEFDLHIVRTNANGSVYEDSINHLSESEREVVGIVFGLSGYLVHEVYDEVPYLLLDSLEALDSERIATPIDFVAEFAPNLVIALLPEDAQAVDGFERITDI